MTELMFLPSAWMDEYVPDPQTDVNLFIFRDDTGTYYLRPVEDQDDAESYSQVLNHGDIVMFDEHRQFGDFTLTINEDGSWETDSPIPTDATCIRVDRDTDTLQPSIRELISENDLQAGVHQIDAYWWSGYETPRRFIVDGDTARFERIEGTAQ